MDTIAKAKTSHGLGLSPFSNMNKDFNLYVFGTRFEHFFLCSSNKKAAPTENEITNAFEHSDYIRMSATTMISGML
jgi:hypothetical protein